MFRRQIPTQTPENAVLANAQLEIVQSMLAKSSDLEDAVKALPTEQMTGELRPLVTKLTHIINKCFDILSVY